jgi:hypothetical protein
VNRMVHARVERGRSTIRAGSRASRVPGAGNWGCRHWPCSRPRPADGPVIACGCAAWRRLEYRKRPSAPSGLEVSEFLQNWADFADPTVNRRLRRVPRRLCH